MYYDAIDKISGSSANIKLRTTATQSMRLYTTCEWVDNGYGSIVARYTSNSVTVYLNPTSSDSFVIVTCTTDKGVEKLMGTWIRINGSSYSGFVSSNVTDGGTATGGSGGSGMYGVKIYSYNLSSASPYITCQQLLQAVTTHDHTYTVKKYYYSSSL